MVNGNVAGRLERVRQLFAEAGLTSATVDAAGQALEIAAVAAPVSELVRLRELAPAVKALGFRYVALELGADGVSGQPAPRPVDESSRELS
jgi:hypothetical protein